MQELKFTFKTPIHCPNVSTTPLQQWQLKLLWVSKIFLKYSLLLIFCGWLHNSKFVLMCRIYSELSFLLSLFQIPWEDQLHPLSWHHTTIWQNILSDTLVPLVFEDGVDLLDAMLLYILHAFLNPFFYPGKNWNGKILSYGDQFFFCWLCQSRPSSGQVQIIILFTQHMVMVFCYQNCSDLLWERIVLVIEKNFWS